MVSPLLLEIALPIIVLLLWGALVVRIHRTVSRNGAWLVGIFYLIAIVGAALLLFGFIGLVTGLTFATLFAAMPWLATGFKPEFMIDPKQLYPAKEITDAIRARTTRSQLIGCAILVADLFLAVFLTRNY